MENENKTVESPLNICKTQLESVNFLSSQGYKISKSTFSEHVNAGLVFSNEDGNFRKDALLGYAVNNLKSNKIDGSNKALEANLNKTSSDAELKRVRAEREKIRLQKEQGQVMLVSEHEKDLAARALFFKREIESFIQRVGYELIEEVNGDEKLFPKLLYLWENKVEDLFDIWAQDKDFVVDDEKEDEFVE